MPDRPCINVQTKFYFEESEESQESGRSRGSLIRSRRSHRGVAQYFGNFIEESEESGSGVAGVGEESREFNQEYEELSRSREESHVFLRSRGSREGEIEESHDLGNKFGESEESGAVGI